MRSQKPILLVEDDHVDAMTVKRSLREINVVNPLLVAGNGEEGAIFRKSDQEKPCIILLDLNMRKMNGIEFLQSVKNDARFKRNSCCGTYNFAQRTQDRVESLIWASPVIW
jgi:CheY-like chemotaxis protein